MDTELVFNLWAILDASCGFIYALSGKCYNLAGDDDEKLLVLQSLAATDYITAKRYNLPKRFRLMTEDGTISEGLAPVQILNDPQAGLFESIFKNIEHELPPVPKFYPDGFRPQSQSIPEDPLCCRTLIYEDEEGNSRAIVSKADIAWVSQQEKLRGRLFAEI